MVQRVAGAAARSPILLAAMRRSLRHVVILCVVLRALPAAADPATTSRLHWVTNGVVNAAAVHDGRLYIGGNFSRVAPAASFLGPWFGVSTTTGEALPPMPLADGPVYAIEPDGSGGYFVGGRFTRIGGVARAALAHVLANGTVDPAFAPALAGIPVYQPFALPALDVRSLARIGSTVYVGGSFTIGTPVPFRTGLAALDAGTAALQPWSPPTGPLVAERILFDAGRLVVLGQTPDGLWPPTALAIDPTSGVVAWTRTLGIGAVFDGVRAGTRLIVGGSFGLTDGSNIRMLASLNPDTGAIDTAWAPVRMVGSGAPPSVYAIAVAGPTVYVGGSFTDFGGFARANLAAVDVALGTVTAWAPEADGTVRDLAPGVGASVYAAGAFRRAGGQARDGLAEIDSSGTATNWTPQAHSIDVRTIHVSDAQVLAGCGSAVAGGAARQNLAGFALDTDDVLPFAPELSEEVLEVGTDGQRVIAGVFRTSPAVPPSLPAVMAFDAGTGAPAAWTAPDFTERLFGVHDGYVYVFTAGTYYMVMRLDAASGAIDESWRFTARPRRLWFDRDRVYFIGDTVSLNGEFREQLFSVDARTGGLSPFNPRFPQPAPGGSPVFVLTVAPMGRTVYVYVEGGTGPAVVAADRESGVAVQPTALAGLLARDLAAADGLLFGVGAPRTAPGVAVRAARPDGAQANWNPGLTLVASDFPRPRILASPADIIVTGVQNVDGVPIHGVGVFPRQASVAASTLEASVLDGAVRLDWAASAQPVSSYVVEAGSASGSSDITYNTGSSVPALHVTASPGTYFVRVRAAGVPPGDAATPTNEIAVSVGCAVPMDVPPTRLAATVSGATVTLAWEAPAFRAVARYVIEAGSAAGLANLARLVVPGTQTTFTTNAPPGTYFVRVRAESACGASPPTADVWLTVGGAALPAAPEGVTATGASSVYSVQWTAVAGATAYVLEAGSRPGLTDVARLVVNATTVGPAALRFGWTYFVRVRAIGAAGIGPPSVEFALIAR